MIEDRIFLSGLGASPVASKRFFVRHADVDDCRAAENFIRQVRERVGKTILTAARKFDKDRMRAEKSLGKKYGWLFRVFDLQRKLSGAKTARVFIEIASPEQ